MNRLRYHMLLIVLVGLISYSNTFHASFHFDDNQNIIENPIVKDYSYFLEPSKAKGLRVYDLFKNRYVGYLTFALNYHLHGLDVTGYHVVNIAIHIANALLVYWLVLLTFRTPFLRGKDLGVNPQLIALFSGLLFVAHPIQTQAVTYIVQRFASLATLFYLLSLAMYIRWRLFPQRVERSGSSIRLLSVFCYLASIVSAVLAMKTKEIAFTLPAIITLYEFMFFDGPVKRRLLSLAPIALTMLIIPLSMISVDKPIGDIIGDVSDATRLQSHLSRWDYLFTQFRVSVTYLRLIVLPVDQNLDYDYPVFHSFFSKDVAPSFLLLVTIFAYGIYLVVKARRTPVLRVIAFGIFWFFITLSVESSVIPIADVIFEHRLYPASLGGILVITTFALFITNYFARWPRVKMGMTLILALAVAIFSCAAYARNTVWQAELTLWNDTVSKSPQKARPHSELALAYENNGQVAAAISYYQTAIKLDSQFQPAYANLGGIYSTIDQDKAIEYYKKALSIDLNNADVHYDLGLVYYDKKLLDKAIEHFELALKLKPEDPDIHNNIGTAYQAKGLYAEAIKHYNFAISLKPDHAIAHYNLAKIYLEEKLINNARNESRLAYKINPDNIAIRELHNYLK